MKRLCDALNVQPHHKQHTNSVRRFFVCAATALSFITTPFFTSVASAQTAEAETKKPGTYSFFGGKRIPLETGDEKTTISVPIGGDRPAISMNGPAIVTLSFYPLFSITQKGDEVTVELITMLDDKNFIETTTARNPGIEAVVEGQKYRVGEPITKTLELGPGEHTFLVLSKNIALAVSSISRLQTAVPASAQDTENRLSNEANARLADLRSIIEVLKGKYTSSEFQRFSMHVDSVEKLITSKRYEDAIVKAKFAQGLFYEFVRSEIKIARESGTDISAAEAKLKELTAENLKERNKILLEALALAEKTPKTKEASPRNGNGAQLSEEQVIREFNEVYGALQFLTKKERYGDNPAFEKFRGAVSSAKKNIDRKKPDQALMDVRYAKTLLYDFVLLVIKEAEAKDLVVADAFNRLQESKTTKNDRISIMLNALALAENAKSETFEEKLGRWRKEIDGEYGQLLAAMRNHGISGERIQELESLYDQFSTAADEKRLTTKQKYDPLKESIAKWKAFIAEEVARTPVEEEIREPQITRNVSDARYGVEYSLLNVTRTPLARLRQQSTAMQHRVHAFARFFGDDRIAFLGSVFGSANTTTISFAADPELQVEGETSHNSFGGSVGILLNALGGDIIARGLVGVSQTKVGLNIRNRSSTVNGNGQFVGGELLYEHDAISLAGNVSNDPFFPASASMTARLPYSLVKGDTLDLGVDFLRFHLLGAVPSGQDSIYDGEVVDMHTVGLARIPLLDLRYLVVSALAGAYHERLSGVDRVDAVGGVSVRNRWGEARGMVTQDGTPMLLAYMDVPIDAIGLQVGSQYRSLSAKLQQAAVSAFRY